MVDILRFSAAAGDERDRFLERFTAAPSAAPAGIQPSPHYVRAVLSIALRRPAELLLAVDGDRAVGRALVATSLARPATAGMGLLLVDSADVMPIGDALIGAATDWARANSCVELFAPLDVNTWFSYRFLVPPEGPGAEVAPFDWEPSQPEGYLELFERQCFDVAERYHTLGGWFSEDGEELKAVIRHTARAHDAARATGIEFEQLADTARLDALLGEIHPLCMEAFRDAPLFEPLPEEMFRALYAASAGARDCSLTHVARDASGALAGFVFAFTDRDAVIVKTIAVSAGLRGQHLSSALVHLVFARAAERGYRHFVSALVRRGNTSDFLAHPSLAHGARVWRHDYVLLRRHLAVG
ncbi:MAG TPA: GNAT family N-acetyltransferase [Gemmatimonadaceae bacterium]|nr:GNAT family N-acetyltransferase [Gemmatimonadaceae bacterium]